MSIRKHFTQAYGPGPAQLANRDLTHMPRIAVVGSDGSAIRAFRVKVEKDHPMSIPSGCMCTWIVKANRIWVLKFESALCPHKGRH